jgi:hypothetical protein
LDGTRAAFALLVHRLWRSPAYVEKLWTAVREPVFAAISLSDYDQREFGKTVEALLRAHARIAAIPGCQPLLKETLAKLQALHQNPSKRNGVYGWPWIEAYDERLLVEDESGISSAWLASFWVRREAEGTREIALSILREIKAHYEKLAARGEVLPSGKADVTGAQPLSREALSKLDARQLRFLRNTLYARHGRDFDSFSLKVYFSRTDWYHPDPAYTDKVLTEVDKANLVLIDEAEKRAGGAMSEERYLDWMFRTLSAMAPKGSPVLEQSLDGKWIVPLACGVERQSIGLSRDSDGVRLIESLGDGTAWAKSCRIVLLEQEGEALVGYDFGPSSCPTVRIHKEGGHIIWDQVHYAPPGAKVRREEIIDKSYCGSAQ